MLKESEKEKNVNGAFSFGLVSTGRSSQLDRWVDDDDDVSRTFLTFFTGIDWRVSQHHQVLTRNKLKPFKDELS